MRGEPVRVTTGLGAYSIAFSGDESRMVYVAYTVRANTRSVPIPSGPAVGLAGARSLASGSQIVEGLIVSPDGRWILYDSNLYGNAELFRIPLAVAQRSDSRTIGPTISWPTYRTMGGTSRCSRQFVVANDPRGSD